MASCYDNDVTAPHRDVSHVLITVFFTSFKLFIYVLAIVVFLSSSRPILSVVNIVPIRGVCPPC